MVKPTQTNRKQYELFEFLWPFGVVGASRVKHWTKSCDLTYISAETIRKTLGLGSKGVNCSFLEDLGVAFKFSLKFNRI